MRTLLKIGYVLLVTVAILVILELAARGLGLGDPVLYYNAAWGGARPLPDQQVERLRGATVTIDANGFRSAQVPGEEALRILYLGDSVTWGGTRITDADIFTEVAADVLRAEGHTVYAMNAGVNGTALINHAEIYRQYADSADAVVWLFPWSDAVRSYTTVGPLWPARYTPRFALVEAVDYVLFRFWINLLRERPPPGAAYRTPEAPLGYDDFFGEVIAAREERNLEATRHVVADAVQRGRPVILGLAPFRDGADLEAPPPEAVRFLDAMETAGATVFDVSAALERAPADLEALFVDHVHYDVAGHRAVGEALGTVLRQSLHSSNAPVDSTLTLNSDAN